MKHHLRTPLMWRAWVETRLDAPETEGMLRGRGLEVDVVRQVAWMEAGLARHAIVRVDSSAIAELLELPLDSVVRARLALVHLGLVVYTRSEGGALWRELSPPPWAARTRHPPTEVMRALERLSAGGEPGYD